MTIQFVARHVLFFVSYLKNSENKLENAAFFKTIKQGIGDYSDPAAIISIDIPKEMFVRCISLVTSDRHGYTNLIVQDALKGVAGYTGIEAQLGAKAMNPNDPDHDDAVYVFTKLGEIRANFAASVEADAVQATLAWLNSISF